jgi:hypothetical protein
MIEWWWLVIEAAVLVGWGAANRGSTRRVAMVLALRFPDKASAELDRWFGSWAWRDAPVKWSR